MQNEYCWLNPFLVGKVSSISIDIKENHWHSIENTILIHFHYLVIEWTRTFMESIDANQCGLPIGLGGTNNRSIIYWSILWSKTESIDANQCGLPNGLGGTNNRSVIYWSIRCLFFCCCSVLFPWRKADAGPKRRTDAAAADAAAAAAAAAAGVEPEEERPLPPGSVATAEPVRQVRQTSNSRWLLGFIACDRLLLGFTGFYWVLLGFTGFYWVLLGFTELYRVLLGFAGFYWIWPGFTGFYRVLPDFGGFYWV